MSEFFQQAHITQLSILQQKPASTTFSTCIVPGERGTAASWLERSSLVLKAPGSKHRLCTGFFNNSLRSPSSKWVTGFLQS